MEITLQHYLAVGAILFTIGVFGTSRLTTPP
jgi:NADH:ubiquinone oxidoreductase subunit K